MKILGVCLLLGSLQAIPEPRIPERYTEPTASVGNGAYNTAQVTKATAKFLHWTRIRNVTWQFDDWNSWRERDGMLCRKSSDCWWLDGDLRCGELTIGENKPNQSWFGGDSASIAGQCMCSYMGDSWYYVGWNEVELECQQTSLNAESIFFIILIGGLPGLVLFGFFAMLMAALYIKLHEFLIGSF